MNHDNPTPLRIGSSGTLEGKRYRVAGRVVMGMEDHGETYYWNEFHLVDGFGRPGTLVFEEGDDGGEWKFFKWFEPLRALSAQEAATKRVGDMVSLDGIPQRVTLVDQSRVYHVEGTAPDGVEVGDVANYFNVDTGSRMLVASWSGDEIEFYEGQDLTEQQVEAAFGFTRPAPAAVASFSPPSFRDAPRNKAKLYTLIVLGVLTALIVFGIYSCRGGARPGAARPSVKRAVPTLRLVEGARGALAGQSYAIQRHAVVEYARTSGRQDLREYQLSSDGANSALLLHGFNNPREWLLLTPVAAPADLGPFEAAAKKRNTPISIEGRTLFLRDMFQAKPGAADGSGFGKDSRAVKYGFVAHDAGQWLIARWTESEIQFHRGTAVTEADVLTAFSSGGK